MNAIPLFDRFSERARKVLSLAQEEAQQFQQSAIGTEHLLLGVVREGESVPAIVLRSLGVTPERLRIAIEEAKGRGNAPGKIELTAHMSTAIEMALKEAERQFPPRSTGITSPLIGSVHMAEDEAVKILQDGKLSQHLESLGVTLEQVRKAVGEAKGRGVQILFDQGSSANTPVGEAERRQHPFFRVGTKHLFLGMLRVPECAGVKILEGLGLPPLKDLRTLLFVEQVTTLPISNQEYAQRFTKQARKAWELAHQESRRLQDSYVGAHHLLLGLVGEGSGVAATVLAEMGVGLEEMREQVEPGYKEGDWTVPAEITLQPKLKNIIELASNEAWRLPRSSISTGHLLLVLVRGRDDQGFEAHLLKGLGVDLESLRTALRRALTEKAGVSEQEIDEADEEGIYASNASIASIERDLQSRDLDRTILAAYPFSIEVRGVLEHARIGATHPVGPEHLLMGLTSLTSGGPVGKVFKDVGIDFPSVRAAVEKRGGGGDGNAASVVQVQSALCRAYLLLAADEAERRDGQGAVIRSEHLLLGLLREEKGIIADLLGDLGTSVETVRTKILESMQDSSPKGIDEV